MRLDKFVSNFSDYSRSEVKKLIKAQRVTINGEYAKQADSPVSSNTDTVAVDGKVIEALSDIYLMFHKPKGLVCANSDSEHPTVIDALRSNASTAQSPLPFNDLQIAGRLDIDTTGLLFITTDGKWNQRVTSPGQHGKKTYRVELANELNDDVIETFLQGVQLKNEAKKTRSATLEKISAREAMLTISEGKYHQVKRMFAAVGNHVVNLHRVSITGVVLDPILAPGEYRPLSPCELDTIQRNIGKSAAHTKPDVEH